jgi:hypothetical protein
MSYLKRRIKRLEIGLEVQKKKRSPIIFVQKNQDGSYCWEGKNYPDMETIEKQIEAVSYIILPVRNGEGGTNEQVTAES